jgi:SAM-dependent methyltransferase
MRDAFLYIAGLGFLTLAKAKHTIAGYTSPKPFQLSDTNRCINYDLKVVDEWLTHLAQYAGPLATVADKAVLELGPGSDLGVGIYLLAKGAATYSACDVNNLMSRVPDAFYARLIERIEGIQGAEAARSLKSEIDAARTGSAARLHLEVRKDFDLLSAFEPNSIDLVFSQAAFEHFDDIAVTVERLSMVCKAGAVIVAEIDLKTHSRWIRDKDPNNIYRYPNALYKAFWFRGIPNRVRPYEYKEAFARHGWTDIRITPIERVRHPQQGAAAAHGQFKDARNEMDFLSIVLCARKL